MCRAVTCTTCGRTTWAGCGRHVDEVRRSVPADQWCPGHQTDSAPTPERSGFLGRLLGR